jgi:hypothetical protein
MSDAWGYDEGAPEEARPPLVLPLIATAIVAALLLIFAFAMPRSLDIGHNDNSVIGALVSGCMVSLILWGIAFAITIRRAGGGWQVGTLLFILVLGVGSQVVAITLAANRNSDDLATVAQQYRALGASEHGPDRVPEGTGPVSRISAAFLNGTLQDRHAFDRDVETLGVLQVLSHEGLTHASPVLHRCADFEALAARARTLGGSGWDGHFAEARRIADEAVRNREMTAGDAEAFFASAAVNHDSYQRQWALDGDMIEGAQELCELLAHRPWTLHGTQIFFASPADLESARSDIERIRANADEQRIAAAAARENMDQAAGQLGGRNPD